MISISNYPKGKEEMFENSKVYYRRATYDSNDFPNCMAYVMDWAFFSNLPFRQ